MATRDSLWLVSSCLHDIDIRAVNRDVFDFGRVDARWRAQRESSHWKCVWYNSRQCASTRSVRKHLKFLTQATVCLNKWLPIRNSNSLIFEDELVFFITGFMHLVTYSLIYKLLVMVHLCDETPISPRRLMRCGLWQHLHSDGRRYSRCTEQVGPTFIHRPIWRFGPLLDKAFTVGDPTAWNGTFDIADT